MMLMNQFLGGGLNRAMFPGGGFGQPSMEEPFAQDFIAYLTSMGMNQMSLLGLNQNFFNVPALPLHPLIDPFAPLL